MLGFLLVVVGGVFGVMYHTGFMLVVVGAVF